MQREKETLFSSLKQTLEKLADAPMVLVAFLYKDWLDIEDTSRNTSLEQLDTCLEELKNRIEGKFPITISEGLEKKMLKYLSVMRRKITPALERKKFGLALSILEEEYELARSNSLYANTVLYQTRLVIMLKAEVYEIIAEYVKTFEAKTYWYILAITHITAVYNYTVPRLDAFDAVPEKVIEMLKELQMVEDAEDLQRLLTALKDNRIDDRYLKSDSPHFGNNPIWLSSS
jgi:hypothetical protein